MLTCINQVPEGKTHFVVEFRPCFFCLILVTLLRFFALAFCNKRFCNKHVESLLLCVSFYCSCPDGLQFFFTALYDFWLRFRVEKFSHDWKTFPPIVKCAVFDELDVSNHIYIFCTCALPKKDSHMDDKIPLRHTYIIHHVLAYNCHLVMTCRNTSVH